MEEHTSRQNAVSPPKRNPARLSYSSGGFSLWIGFMLFLLFVMSYPLQMAAQIISTFAGTGLAGYYGDGQAATLAMLDSPTYVAVDGAGNVYINDQRNSCVRKVTPAGIISTFAGTGTAGYGGDNGPATAAQLNSNWGIAIDDTGNVYIADQTNCRVRKVNTSGTITTFAGNGTPGFSGNGGAATSAQIQSPLGVAVDGHGNVYIGDRNNFRVRKVNTAGIITTFAGNGVYGYNGDNGPATSASLSYIWGLAADAIGNVYICDGQNNRVRKVDTAGVITTIAGTGTAGNGGDGGLATAAQLNLPIGVFISSTGDIYISDFHNNRIRKINSSGIITTVAGTGTNGFSGDNGPALAAELSHPISVAMDNNNNIYIADLDNVRVRKINTVPALSFTGGHSQNFSVCENAPATPINALLSVQDYYNGITDTWSLISGAVNGMIAVSYTTTATGSMLTPAGISYTPNTSYVGYDSFKVRVTNGFTSDTMEVHITVQPTLVSAGTITGPTNVCIGATITLTDTLAGGIWSTDYMASIVTTTHGGVVTGILPGVDTIKYTVNGCGIATSIITITVNPLPDAGTITGLTNICVGSSITLTETVTGGIWSDTTGKTSINPIPGGVNITGINSGTDIISYRIADSLCTGVAVHTIEIDSIPAIGIISGPINICIGASAIYTDPAPYGIWSGDTSASGKATATIVSDTVTGIAAGTYNISYSITNACGTFAATQSINIISLPDVPVVSNYGGTLTAPTGYASYQWILDGMSIPGAITDTYQILNAGVYAVMVTDSPGCAISSADQNYASCSTDDIKIFPNPNTSTLYIDWCKKLTARVICLDGKVLKTIENAREVDLATLPDGIYMISLFDTYGNKLITKQITKLTR